MNRTACLLAAVSALAFAPTMALAQTKDSATLCMTLEPPILDPTGGAAQAIKDRELPRLLPGIKVSTGPADHMPVKQMQMMRFDGKQWVRFGDVQTGR